MQSELALLAALARKEAGQDRQKGRQAGRPDRRTDMMRRMRTRTHDEDYKRLQMRS